MHDGPVEIHTANVPRARDSLGYALVVAALTICYVALGLSASLRKSQTGDEGAHLTGGVSYWARNDYRIQPENGNLPERLGGLPVWLSGYQLPSTDNAAWRELRQWDFAEEFFYQSGNDADQMLLRGRAVMTLLGVSLAWLICGWSRRLFGPAAGLLSLTIFVFSPPMLTHGFLITSDMASALFFTAAVASLWRLLHRVSPWTLTATWLALSGLFLSKFAAPMIVPIGGLLLVVRLCNRRPAELVGWGPARECRGPLRQFFLYLAIVPLLVLGVALSIWASYGFRYAMLNPALGASEVSIDWAAVTNKSATVNRSIEMAREQRLLPEAYLYGFSHVLRNSASRSAFLNGAYRHRGWRSFFPYCFAYKTPLAVFVILVLAAAAGWRFGRAARKTSDASAPGNDAASRARPDRSRLYEITPLIALLAVYWAFAITSHLNIGHRHLLPIYPALFIMAGAAAWWFAPAAWACHVPPVRASAPRQSARRSEAGNVALRCVLVGALLWAVGDGLWIWPHYLAYFNPLAGGPWNGYRHLVDSSLDWSQDLKETKAWLDAHPNDTSDPRRLYFAFYGAPPPEYYGIHAQRLPSFPFKWQPHVTEPLTGGTYLISATTLPGVVCLMPGRWNEGYESLYRNLRRSFNVYRTSSTTAEGRRKLTDYAPEQQWQAMLNTYETARFMRLASYLRQREPDDEIGYSILVYRLTDEEVAEAIDGPPVELLPEPEWETENRRYGIETENP
ncbi:MAG TPA: hypothetical protein VHD36_07435 [Pirellulales bacterium]|nr:hypothetical protein [Pirellulales bacterium]